MDRDGHSPQDRRDESTFWPDVFGGLADPNFWELGGYLVVGCARSFGWLMSLLGELLP